MSAINEFEYNGYKVDIIRDPCSKEYYTKIYDEHDHIKKEIYFRLTIDAVEEEVKKHIDEVLNV